VGWRGGVSGKVWGGWVGRGVGGEQRDVPPPGRRGRQKRPVPEAESNGGEDREMTHRISRRTVLKGVGTALALPLLDAMQPQALAAALPSPPLRGRGVGGEGVPKRMAFLYVPNGIHMQDFIPTTTGKDFALPYLPEPLKDLRNDFSVLSGLTLDKARPNGDGPGDHARAMSVFLTGRQPRKTAGADIKVGISVDQLAAQKIGERTRFPSLEIGCEAGRPAGHCDSGYSCAYSANLSWRSEATPQPKEIDPKLVFDRLFSSANAAEAAAAREKRERHRKSILDLVAEDAGDLKRQLGATDQRKLDEYLTGVRELEVRLAKAGNADFKNIAPPKDAVRPTGIPREYQEHIRLLSDLLVLAFQGDVTPIATFALANDGSNRPYRSVGVPEGHQALSPHGGDKVKHEKIKKINCFHIGELAYLLKRLKSIKEGNGTLLDSCMIVYGSGIGDGNAHNHDNLPILLAGKGGGTLTPGQHVRFRRETPLTNLYVSMLDRVGVHVESFGDSNGRLSGI